jgi:hypothetical protein
VLQLRQRPGHLPALGLDERDELLRRPGVLRALGVGVDRLQVVVSRLDLPARDRPAAFAPGALRQELEEVAELLDGQRSLLADLDVREVEVPGLLGRLALGEERVAGDDATQVITAA